jgi:hypothetical protein
MMRVILTAAMLIALAGLLGPQTGVTAAAQAQECTGENCPPPAGQGRGSHCEKNEDTVS